MTTELHCQTVRIAKADLVPTDANLRADYRDWAELVDACDAFMADVVKAFVESPCYRRGALFSVFGAPIVQTTPRMWTFPAFCARWPAGTAGPLWQP